jgi:uncharacterized protein (TIGR03437 family)
VYGTNLAAGPEAATGNPLPNILAGSEILINGVAAPLLFAGPSQINAQVPYETLAGVATVVAKRGSSVSGSVALKIQETAPGIFVMLNQDGTVNGPKHPAAPGSNSQVFVTGLGPTEPSWPSGVQALAGSSANATVPLSAAIGGQNAPILNAGLAPGLVGVFKVILNVPAQTPGNYSLVIQAAGVSSNSLAVSIGP